MNGLALCFRWLTLLALAVTLSSCTQEADSTNVSFEPPTSKALVDPDWLQSNFDNPDVRLLELGRTEEEFLEQHIPGAQFVDWREDISDPSIPDRYNLLPISLYEQLLSRLGVTEHATVVLYDAMNNRASVRMFWIMKYYNHPDVRVLDGGLGIWEIENHALTNKMMDFTPSNYKVSSVNSNLLVDFDHVYDSLSDSSVKLVDGRPFDQYTGESAGTVFHTGTEHQRLGHIYGAESVPWAENLREDGTFKSPAELIEIYGKHHVVNEGTVITYCNEGLHAAMPWFVLHELLGFDDVRLYDDSMAEWANIFDTPMITGERCM